MLLSGACEGADETFGRAALMAGHRVVHLLCDENSLKYVSEHVKKEQSHCLYHLPNVLLEKTSVVEAVRRAGSHRLPETSLVDGWEAKISASRRNFFQVRCASSVYAVGWRLCEGVNPLTFEPLPAGEQGQGIDVGGGTGWACQFYIDRFGPGGEDPSSCRLYFFDK